MGKSAVYLQCDKNVRRTPTTAPLRRMFIYGNGGTELASALSIMNRAIDNR